MREDYLNIDKIREQMLDGKTGISHDQAKFLISTIEMLKQEISEKVEHSKVHYGKEEFVGIDGYGHYSLRKVCKERWEVILGSEKIILFNRKGKRILGEVQLGARDWDGDW